MRIKLAVAMFFLACGLANAQTCTPVKMSQNATNRDDGTGPNYFIGVNNNLYTPSTTVTIAAGTIQIGGVQIYGYYDVFGGFGGCQGHWSAENIVWWHLTENNQIVYATNPAATALKYCGYVASCAFTDTQTAWVGVPLVSGHTYLLTAYVYGLFTNLPGNAQSTTYSAWVKIVVQ